MLSDSVINQLWAYISEEYGLEYKENDIGIVIRIIALSQSYNPIKIMLQKAKATSKDVDPFKVIQKYINIEDNQYNRIVLDLFFREQLQGFIMQGYNLTIVLILSGNKEREKVLFT